MANNSFTINDLERINLSDDLKISPFRADGATYGTPTWIWNVVVDGELYVRAYNGKTSRSYQSALKQKAGKIIAAGMDKEVIFETVGDVELLFKIDSAYQLKYKGSLYLQSMINERAKAATIHIIQK